MFPMRYMGIMSLLRPNMLKRNLMLAYNRIYNGTRQVVLIGTG